MKLIAKKSLWIAVITLLLIAAAISFFYTRENATTIINNQLAALRANDIKKAYSLTSQDFQRSTSLENFTNVTNHYPPLSHNVKTQFTQDQASDQAQAKVTAVLYDENGTTLPVEYHLIKEQNQWKIKSILINVNDMTNKNKPANPILPNTYTDKNNRFSISYPKNWDDTQPNKGSIVLRGKKGTPDFQISIDIETILGKKIGGEFSTVDEFITDLKTQYGKYTKNIQYIEEAPIAITQADGSKITGKYLIFTYNYDQYSLKQWQIILLRHDDPIFYLWAFTAPQNLYDQTLPTAKAILNSWDIF